MATATLPSFTTPSRATTRVSEVAAEGATPPVLDIPRIYVSSILAVSFLFVVAVGIPMSLFLEDWMGGMGLGLFTAFWGGPSFGVMTGSARVSAWQEKYGEDH